jgi:hypothetical protein
MKAKAGQIWVAASLAALAGMAVSSSAQMTGGQARAAQAQASSTVSGNSAPATAGTPPAQNSNNNSAASAPKLGAPRRDPFKPLIQPKTAEAMPIRLPAGKPGLVIGQLSIQGIVRGIDGKWMAVVDNKTKRSYFLYERDELYNGVVTSITADSVTFEERSLDTAGRTRSREVVKRIGI